MDVEFKSPVGPERRKAAASTLRVERRADGDDRPRIVGHAAVFDRWTTIYEGRRYVWREVIRPGAFTRAVSERQDVRALFNHDPNFILGRTTAETLKLAEDAIGLFSETLPSDSQTVRDLVLTPISRGEVSGMSFAFMIFQGDGSRVREEKPDGSVVITTPGEKITIWEDGEKLIEERELLNLDLIDVSPVTFPAYAETDVSLRSLGEAREKTLFEEVERRQSQSWRRSDLDAKVRRMRLALAE